MSNNQSPQQPDAQVVKRRKSTRGHAHKSPKGDVNGVEPSSSKPADSSESAPQPASASARQELSPELLEELARRNVRRSAYGPEFLREVAKRTGEAGDGAGHRFSIVDGPDAESIMDSYLGEYDHHRQNSQLRSAHLGSPLRKPVVFAFPVQHAGRKFMDYYMTWKGKMPKAHRLKGQARKDGFLDDEFGKVSKYLEEEYKRLADTFPTEHSAAAPVPDVVAAGEENDKLGPLEPPKLPFASMRRESNGSVTSLPYLGAVPNVPANDRVPLRVVNPDSSMFSSADSRRDTLVPPSPVAAEIAAAAAQAPATDGENTGPRAHESHGENGSPAVVPSSAADSESEILIVLVDDKSKKKRRQKGPTWHKLNGRKVSRRVAPPERKNSARQSPWDGPMLHQLPLLMDMYDSDDSLEDAVDRQGEDYSPVLPLRAALSALGYISTPSPSSQQPQVQTQAYVNPTPNPGNKSNGAPPAYASQPLYNTNNASTRLNPFDGNAYAASLGLASPYSSVGSLHPAANSPYGNAPMYLAPAATPYAAASSAPNLPSLTSPYGATLQVLPSVVAAGTSPYALSVPRLPATALYTPASVMQNLGGASPYGMNPGLPDAYSKAYPVVASGGPTPVPWSAAAYGPY